LQAFFCVSTVIVEFMVTCVVTQRRRWKQRPNRYQPSPSEAAKVRCFPGRCALGAVDEESQFVGPGDVVACCPQVVPATQIGPHQNNDVEQGSKTTRYFKGIKRTVSSEILFSSTATPYIRRHRASLPLIYGG
jgi:hypothetical protein